MSLFKQTATDATQIGYLLEEVDTLVREYKRAKQINETQFTVRDRFVTEQDDDGIGSADEIEQQPVRKGHVVGEEPMTIVFVEKNNRWVPGLFRKSAGEMGRIVNRDRGINMRVAYEDLSQLSDQQLKNAAIRKLKEKYPKARFFIYKRSQTQDNQ